MHLLLLLFSASPPLPPGPHCSHIPTLQDSAILAPTLPPTVQSQIAPYAEVHRFPTIPLDQSLFSLWFLLFWGSTGFELRTSQLKGRHSTTWVMAPALFCFNFFFDRVLLLPWVVLGLQSSYLRLLYSCGYKHAPLHPACYLRWGLTNFLPGLT
jgi:hypothetical protein